MGGHKRVFILCGGSNALKEICERLLHAGLSRYGLRWEKTSLLANERISEGTPETMREQEVSGLTVVLAENPAAGRTLPRPLTHGLPDEAFLRGKTPMTKLEVRSVSLSKLALTENAVVYDVGSRNGLSFGGMRQTVLRDPGLFH